MNLIDYIKNNNKTFLEESFNEIDALAFAILPYIDFKDIIGAFHEKPITLKDANQKLAKKKIKDTFINNAYKLINEMAKSKRFKDILLYNYMYIINTEMQFGALTVKLPDKSIFVSFAGTDSSIIGWKEDFKMAYLYPGVSQKYASVYLTKTINLFNQNIRIGGHSKGGNLAISASMNASLFLKRRIKEIYNFDGPGFLKEQVNSKNYQKIEKKIKMYVPEDSVVGMILYHTKDYVVVKAKYFSIFQHDAFEWFVSSNKFILAKQNKRSINIEHKLTKKLEALPIQERTDLVEKIFSIFKKNEIHDTKQIKLNHVIHLIRDFKELDKTTQDLLLELFTIIFLN